MTETRKRPTAAKGFTLLELLTVTALLSLMIIIGMPALQNMIHRSRLEGAARDLRVLMLEARAQALKRGAQAVLMVDLTARQAIAYIDLDGATINDPSDLQFNPVLGQLFKMTDYEIRRVTLPNRVNFSAPGAEPIVDNLTDLPGVAMNGVVFQTDGSVLDSGSIRIGDQQDHFLQVRIAPRATARVALSKWDPVDSLWYEQGHGGKNWEW